MGRDGESKILFPTMKSLDSDKKAGKSGAVEEATANDNNGFFKDNAKIDFSNVCLLYTSPSPRD